MVYCSYVIPRRPGVAYTQSYGKFLCTNIWRDPKSNAEYVYTYSAFANSPNAEYVYTYSAFAKSLDAEYVYTYSELNRDVLHDEV